MVGIGGRSGWAGVGGWVGVIGLGVAVTPRIGVGQQSAVVHATGRVVVSVAAENRGLVSGLARAWGRGRAGLLAARGSLALVRLRVVGVAAVKPVAIVDIQYLRN